MAFRARDPFKITTIAGFHPVELVEDINSDGRGLVHIFDPSVEKLPDMVMFDLDSLVKAKVPLDKTNTKILGGDALLVADALMDLEDNDNNNNNEVNNE